MATLNIKEAHTDGLATVRSPLQNSIAGFGPL